MSPQHLSIHLYIYPSNSRRRQIISSVVKTHGEIYTMLFRLFKRFIWCLLTHDKWPKGIPLLFYKVRSNQGRHGRFLAGKDAIVAATSQARCGHHFLKIQPRTKPWLPWLSCFPWRPSKRLCKKGMKTLNFLLLISNSWRRTMWSRNINWCTAVCKYSVKHKLAHGLL